MSDLVVVKYGGSVLKDADSYRAAAQYQIKRGRVALVSAMDGVTNFLMTAYDAADYKCLRHLFRVYSGIAKPLPRLPRKHVMAQVRREMENLRTYLDIGARDAFIGSAEGDSAIFLRSNITALGGDAEYIRGPNAGFFLNKHGLVEMEASRKTLSELGKKLDKGKIIVIGGYVGWEYKPDKTKQYKLGARNINDAFAAALADALEARAVEIIKDVPGVYRVPPEFGDYGLLERLSYDEASKMSWRGSPVVHPSAIIIAKDKCIPIIVKDMKSEGTVISAETQTTPDKFVAALVPEKTHTVTVLDPLIGTHEGMDYPAMISQFGKELETAMVTPPLSDIGWISYRVRMGDRKRALDSKELFREHLQRLKDHLYSNGYKPTVQGEEVGVITLVGDKMQGKIGVFSYLSGILSRKGISMRSIVHGDEKYTPPGISIVVDNDKLELSVDALTEELFAEVKK